MPTTLIQQFPERVQLELFRPEEAVLVPVTIAQGFACQQGDVLGQITTTGKARRRSRTLAAGAGFSAASAVGNVADASVFAPGDVLTTSTGLAIGTIAANGVNVQNNTVTLQANSANAVAAGTAVIATDGSAVAKGIADDGSDGTNDTPMAAIIEGVLNPALLRGLDSSAISDLSGALVFGNAFKF